MKYLLSLFLCLMMGITAPAAHAANSKRVVEVRIASSDKKAGQHSSGTAFLINSENTWLTARHVVEGCKNIYLSSQFATTYTNRRTNNVTKSRFIPAKLKALDSRSDSALLVAEGDFSNKQPQPLTLGKPYQKLKTGDAGFIIGYPKGEHGEVALHFEKSVLAEQAFPNGIIHYEMDKWSIEKRNTATNANQGLSGGPVINHQGAVVGINAAGLNKSRRFLGSSSTVPLDALHAFLKKHRLHRSLSRHPNGFINQLSYKNIGRNMRKNQQVVKVFCER